MDWTILSALERMAQPTLVSIMVMETAQSHQLLRTLGSGRTAKGMTRPTFGLVMLMGMEGPIIVLRLKMVISHAGEMDG